jgi:large subunit ribosomal protein L13
LAEIRLNVPAVGAGSGVPLLLGGGGALSLGVGAPPVAATAGAAQQARKTASAIIDIDSPSQGLAPALLRATRPLFRSPAELAVGLALKEMRYGQWFVRFAPGTCNGPYGSSAPIRCAAGIRLLLARQYTGLPGARPCCGTGRARGVELTAIIPEPLGLPRGFSLMKTYVANPSDRERNWLVVDAEGQTLGRLATRIADALRGKRKPEYTPHVDTGDFVVVINAEKIRVTGKKMEQKRYWRHSGYPGGIKSRTLAEMLDRRPEEVIRKAVKGMLPRNRLARKQLTKLKVYAGPDHPHAAQKPQPMETT